jgi:hypothetical protein
MCQPHDSGGREERCRSTLVARHFGDASMVLGTRVHCCCNGAEEMAGVGVRQFAAMTVPGFSASRGRSLGRLVAVSRPS